MVSDMSVPFFAGAVIGFLILMFLYRQTNAKLSVFPQTNNSRFISSLAINYAIAGVVAIVALIMYLLSLAVFKILSRFVDNIYFALNIDIWFIVFGFFVYLAYIFLFIAFIELIAAILRKWTYYAIAVFVALASLAAVNIAAVVEQAPNALSFLIREPSLSLFFIKAIGLWLVITVAGFIINRFTVYHKSRNKALDKGVIIACAVIVPLVTFVLPGLVWFNTASGSGENNSVTEFQANPDAAPGFIPEHEQIRIDVSHLPKGSDINIKGTGIAIVSENGGVSYNHNIEAVLMGAETLKNIEGDTIVINFIPTQNIVNGIELLQYGNQRVTAYLDINTLYIDYAIDSANVVIMPIWGIVRQFDLFKDKGVLTAQALGFSSGWYGSNNIFVSVE
jgi:hypothetical protein